MNLVDSSGWLEYFGSGKNAHFFAPALRETDALVVPNLCIYEVFKRILAQRGEEDALQAIGIMSLGTVADVTREIAVDAAAISHTRNLAMADSIILATARAHDATLWTQEANFSELEGVRYIKKI